MAGSGTKLIHVEKGERGEGPDRIHFIIWAGPRPSLFTALDPKPTIIALR